MTNMTDSELMSECRLRKTFNIQVTDLFYLGFSQFCSSVPFTPEVIFQG